MTKLTAEQIEAHIDAHGAWDLLLTIGMVLGEKADHIEANWQDRKLAAKYRRYGKACDTLMAKLEADNV